MINWTSLKNWARHNLWLKLAALALSLATWIAVRRALFF